MFKAPRRTADDAARGLMLASPVRIPTFSGPSSEQRAKNFSLASALIGLV
jgi:hypothetical protein